MRKHTKAVAAGVALCMLAVPLSACGMQATGNVSVANKTVTVTADTYVSALDLLLIDQIGKKMTPPIDAAALGLTTSKLDKVTVNGKEYYTSSDPKTGLHLSESLKASDLAQAGCILDNDKFVMYSPEESDLTSAAQAIAGLDTSMLPTGVDPSKLVEFTTFSLVFDKTPIATNGNLDGNTVEYTDWNKELFWTAFTTKASEAKASSIKPTVKNKTYTKKQSVTFKTPGIVSGYKVDGKAAAPAPVAIDNKLKTNTVKFAKQGKHKITVNLTSGAKKTFTYVYDKAAPKANVKASKSYKAGKKLSVKDKYGLKSVKLDGKKVKLAKKGKKASIKLAKTGSHKLVATDKAGNKLTVKFKVK